MIIENSDLDHIPEDAVLLSSKEVIDYYKKNINSWRNWKDKWAIQYGIPVLGASTYVYAFHLNYYYRSRLKLYGKARIVTYAFGAVLPGLFHILAHTELVTNQVYLQNPCRKCVIAKSLGIQSFLNFSYGLVLAPLLNIFMVQNYNIAYFGFSSKEDWKEIWKLWLKFQKRFIYKHIAYAAFNAGLVFYITQSEYDNFDVLCEKFKARELQFIELAEQYNNNSKAIANKI